MPGRVGSGSAGNAEAYRFFVPGLLIQLGLFGSMFVGFAIISDWRGGVIERFRVTPVSRLAVMSGRVLRDTLVLVVQAVILVLVGIAFGLRAPVSAVFISLGFIVLVAVGLASVSYATALTVKSEDAFAPMLNSVIVPLVLLSGILLPMTLAPGWLQGVAAGLVHEPPGLWTSRHRATRRAGRTCGSTSGACGPTWAPRSSSPRTTWTRRTRCATGCSSSTTA